MNDALIKETVSSLLQELHLSATSIEVREDGEEMIRVDIASHDASRIIGWHGETLNSIQHLVKAIVRSKENLDRSPFIVLDVDGYRKSQEDKVRSAAERKADFVRRTGNRVALPPMNPYFRRIVHLHVANSEHLQDLTTLSTGQGDYRQIVLRLKDESASTQEGGEELSPVLDKQEEDDLGNLDI